MRRGYRRPNLLALLLLSLVCLSCLPRPSSSEDDALHTCSLSLDVPSGPTSFAVRPRHPYVTKYLAALRFARRHGLSHGDGCDSQECVARRLLRAVDRGLCAQLQRQRAFFVSVGESCAVATALRSLGARSAAFPFDWNLKPLESVVSMLRSNFSSASSLLRPETTRFAKAPYGSLGAPRETHASASSERPLVPAMDDAAGILFTHDFFEAAAGDDASTRRDRIDAVRAKYARRIRRLQRLLTREEREAHVFLVTKPAQPGAWTPDGETPAFAELGVDPAAWFNAERFERARASLVEFFAKRPNVHVISSEEASDLLTEIGTVGTTQEAPGIAAHESLTAFAANGRSDVGGARVGREADISSSNENEDGNEDVREDAEGVGDDAAAATVRAAIAGMPATAQRSLLSELLVNLTREGALDHAHP